MAITAKEAAEILQTASEATQIPIETLLERLLFFKAEDTDDTGEVVVSIKGGPGGWGVWIKGLGDRSFTFFEIDLEDNSPPVIARGDYPPGWMVAASRNKGRMGGFGTRAFPATEPLLLYITSEQKPVITRFRIGGVNDADNRQRDIPSRIE